jgi:hypothetical protein
MEHWCQWGLVWSCRTWLAVMSTDMRQCKITLKMSPALYQEEEEEAQITIFWNIIKRYVFFYWMHYTIIVFCWGQCEFLWTLKTIFTEALGNVKFRPIRTSNHHVWNRRWACRSQTKICRNLGDLISLYNYSLLLRSMRVFMDIKNNIHRGL